MSNFNIEHRTRPIILVSSTSWTKDEDFSILLNAMKQYESKACMPSSRTNHYFYPQLLLIITGKGPEKEFYLRQIRREQHKWKYITIRTAWLEAEDYPRLLAAADLGICLHYSSSGVDLPMKVVDMFGAGLPVLAINFKSINELVQHGKQGYVFDDADQLA